MAAYEINQRGGIQGRLLDVQRFNWSSKDTPTPAAFAARAATLFATPNLVALAHNAYDLTPGLVAESNARNVSIVSPTSIHGVGWAPTSLYTINTRPRALEEATQLLQYALNSHHHCRSIMVATFAVADLMGSGTAVVAKLKDLGYDDPTVLDISPVTSSTVVATMMIDVAAKMPTPPQCYFLFFPSFWSQVAVEKIMENSTLAAVDPIFLSTSISTRFAWKHSVTKASGMYKNVITSSTFPHPSDTRFNLIKSFRATGTAALAAGAMDSLSPTDDQIAPQSLEGYITGRFIEAALSRQVGAMTGATVADVAFTTKMFDVDDISVGPFIRSCPGFRTSAAKTCWCNTGGRSVFMSQVSGATGHPQPLFDNATLYEDGAVQGVIPLGECGFPASFPVPSKTVLSVFESTLPAADLAIATTVGTTAASTIFNARVSGAMPTFWSHPTVVRTTGATTQSIEHLVSKRYDTMMVIGLTAKTGSLSVPNVAPLSNGAAWAERDKDTVPFSEFNYLEIAFWPTLADLAHTAASFAAAEFKPPHSTAAAASQQLHIIADTHSMAALAVRSAETHLRRSPTSVRVLDAASPPTTLFPGGAGLPSSGFVLLITQRADVLSIVRTLAAAVPNAQVLLCTSDLLLDAHRPSTNDELSQAASIPGNFFYVSGLPGYRNATKAATLYGEAIGALVLRSALAAGAGSGKPLSPATMIENVYSAGSLSAGILSLQPLSRAACAAHTTPGSGVFPHPGGRCQCTKGLNTFHVMDAKAVVNTSFTHSYCGVQYTPLPKSSSDGLSTATIAVIAVGGALLLAVVGAVVALVLLRGGGGHDVTHAPKDASQPFAIVFTDIQSSTCLWARAPQ